MYSACAVNVLDWPRWLRTVTDSVISCSGEAVIARSQCELLPQPARDQVKV